MRFHHSAHAYEHQREGKATHSERPRVRTPTGAGTCAEGSERRREERAPTGANVDGSERRRVRAPTGGARLRVERPLGRSAHGSNRPRVGLRKCNESAAPPAQAQSTSAPTSPRPTGSRPLVYIYSMYPMELMLNAMGSVPGVQVLVNRTSFVSAHAHDATFTIPRHHSNSPPGSG